MKFENQRMLETLFDERQTPKLLRREILASPTLVALIQASELPSDFAIDLLSQMMLLKRATLPQLIGLLKRHFVPGDNPWQACADALLQAAEKNLVDWSVREERFILRYDLDEATHRLMRQYQFLPPMIVPPLELHCNRGSGYLTIRDDSLILKKNHHEGDIGLDSLHRFNQIPLKLNIDVATQVKNSWKHLDHCKPHESFEEYQQRVKAFDKYQRDTAWTMALMVEMGNQFYMTHKVDKRGRTYCQGYHISPQGTCWNKAVIELADEELVQ